MPSRHQKRNQISEREKYIGGQLLLKTHLLIVSMNYTKVLSVRMKIIVAYSDGCSFFSPFYSFFVHFGICLHRMQICTKNPRNYLIFLCNLLFPFCLSVHMRCLWTVCPCFINLSFWWSVHFPNFLLGGWIYLYHFYLWKQ